MAGNRTGATASGLIEAMFDASIAASNPESAVRRHLCRDGDDLVLDGEWWPVRGRLTVVGAGKAAVPMARAVEAIGGDLIGAGLVITKDGHASAPVPAKIEVVEAAHPIPDQRAVEATRRILTMVDGLGPDDVVMALISGGGSALLEAPRDGITLDDMARVTELLLRAGAPIQDLNTVRRPLSQVKGGGLSRAAGNAPVLALMLSDVLGNDPQIIASGPTVPSPTTGADALATLDRYHLRDRTPAAVLALLQRRESPRRSSPANGAYAVIADNQTAIDAAVAVAEHEGKRVEVVWRQKEGEAADLGRAWVRHCLETPPFTDVLVGGGETTVTVRGNGVGGRNTEFALAAAHQLALATDPGWIIASLATDGQDGPTGVAGAMADAETVRRAEEHDVDPREALTNNDSLRVFEAAGGLVAPGPTGTNVNDLYIAVRTGV